jgi:hypothetical protein
LIYIIPSFLSVILLFGIVALLIWIITRL